MPLTVEFFGIPRQRAGVADLTLEDRPATLAELWCELGRRCPGLAGERSPHFAVNLEGRRFVDDPATSLEGVTHVLILSADAGG